MHIQDVFFYRPELRAASVQVVYIRAAQCSARSI